MTIRIFSKHAHSAFLSISRSRARAYHYEDGVCGLALARSVVQMNNEYLATGTTLFTMGKSFGKKRGRLTYTTFSDRGAYSFQHRTFAEVDVKVRRCWKHQAIEYPVSHAGLEQEKMLISLAWNG